MPRPGLRRFGALRITVVLAVPWAIAVPARGALIEVVTLDDLDLLDGQCSLREAIVAANLDVAYQDCPAGSGADEVVLTVAGAIVLASDLPVLDEGLTLRGLGTASSSLDGGGLARLLSLAGPAGGIADRLRLELLRLTGGRGVDGGAVSVGAGRSLEVVECLIEGNVASGFGGGLSALGAADVLVERSTVRANVAQSRDGGGLAVTFADSLTVVESTISGNASPAANGGGIFAYFVDAVTVRRSTLSGNSAGRHGGGLEQVGGEGRIEFSTVAGNSAGAAGEAAGWGGGIEIVATGGSLTLRDSVVAGNADLSPDDGLCPDLNARLRGVLVSNGYNLIGIHECGEAAFPEGAPNGNGDFVGTLVAPIDAGLGPLADNGGPTPTHRPLIGSATVDQGGCPGEETDQRGYRDPVTLVRPVDDPAVPDFGDGCDIGAVERHPDPPPPALPFLDGFESGDTLAWSSTVP